MIPTQIEELRREFEEKFGHDHPFNGECTSVNIGNDCDCRTKDMVDWFLSKITSREEEVRREERKRIKRIFETMWETGKPAKGDDIGNGVVYGWNDCLTNCIAQVADSLTSKEKHQ